MAVNALYTIDPGLTGTGWARWMEYRQGFVLDAVGIFHVYPQHTKSPWDIRASSMNSRMLAEMRPIDGRAYIEFPQYMAGSIAGRTAAQKGDTLKLAYLCGLYAQSLRRRKCSVTLVTPMEWKGQLPKDVVVSRVRRELGEELCMTLKIKSHAWDAVGLGLWALQRL